MQLWDEFGLPQKLAESLPNYLIKPISAHVLGAALGRSTHSQRRVTVAEVIEVLLLSGLTPGSNASHLQSAFAAFDQRAKQVTARIRLIHLASGFSIASELQLRFVKDLGRDDGWSFT